MYLYEGKSKNNLQFESWETRTAAIDRASLLQQVVRRRLAAEDDEILPEDIEMHNVAWHRQVSEESLQAIFGLYRTEFLCPFCELKLWLFTGKYTGMSE